MNPIGVAVGALFLAVFGLIAVIAARRPLLARIAVRDAVRRPLQSAVVIGGLMIGTGAILGPQVWLDSIEDSLAAADYRSWGRVDLTVSAGGDYFSPEIAERIAADPSVRRSIVGVQAGLEAVGSVIDVDRDQAKPNVRLVGFDPATQSPFGAFVLPNDRKTTGTDLSADEVLVSSQLADAIEARAGDRLNVTASGRSTNLRVGGVAGPEGPGAYGLRASLFVPLSTMQRLVGTDLINVVRLAARGEGQAEVDTAHAVIRAVRQVVVAAAGGSALEVREDKAVEAEAYRRLHEANRPYFLGFSFFVLAVGVALVINLAVTLAEERRPRMAVLRALGLTRAGLVAVSVIEGAMYSLVAAVAGIVPGGLVGWALFTTVDAFQTGPVNGRDVVFQPSLRPGTVAASLAAGALITVVVLFLASIRTSRMSIASAIRQLPEPAQPQRRSWLRVAVMLALAAAGILALLAGHPALRLLGGVALIALASMLARGRIDDRSRATMAGLGITAWSFVMFAIAPSNLPSAGSARVPSIFQILAVGTATSVFGLSFLLAANLRLVERLGEIPGRAAAGLRVTLRPPIAYLTRRPFRAGLATSGFAMIVALQVVATVNVQAAGHPDYTTTSYDVVATSSGSLDLGGVSSRVDHQLVIPTRLYVGPARARLSQYEAVVADWRQLSVPLYSLSDEVLRQPPFARLYSGGPNVAPDQQGIWARLRSDPSAVITSIGYPGDIITLKSLRGGEVKFTVLASFAVGFMRGIAGSASALAAFADLPEGATALVRTAPGSDSAKVAAEIRRRFVRQGVDATTTRRLLDDGVGQARATSTIIHLLLAMGVVVAVFSLGVLALRAVVERRRAIGVLRALGYQPSQILAGMLGESSLSAALGIVVGLTAGLMAASFVGEALTHAADLTDERGVLGLIYLGVLALTLVVTAGPALQASRLTPVEALRVVD